MGKDHIAEEVAFEGSVVEWRGPAPFYFVSAPLRRAQTLRDAAKRVSYGWGCVPVTATIEATEFQTSLIPKGGSYLLPLKAAVRRELDVAPGERVRVTLRIAAAPVEVADDR